jgi:4-diphosphocytidyl-2-C-methyl-D-erythritol kinase
LLEIEANAKINLFLDIKRRREDGYHEIETIYQSISLADKLTIDIRPGEISLEVDDEKIPQGSENLAFRIAKLLKETVGEKKGAHLKLQKRIPPGSGLGGGSADAASVLKGLNNLWELGLNLQELCSIGAKLGMDIPFQVIGGTALGTGRGEHLKPLSNKCRNLWFILVFPEIEISTGKAYEKWAEVKPKAPTKNINDFITVLSRGEEIWPCMSNVFDQLVIPDHPELEMVRKVLIDSGAKGVQLSGSGSTVYGGTDTAEEAQRIAADVGKTGYRTEVVQPVNP